MPVRYRCSHCGQSCGKTGHLRRENTGGRLCPTVGGWAIASGIDSPDTVRVGFACPDGHTCMASAFPSIFMQKPLTRRNWRDDPASDRQLEYLYALGYTGARPVTKGQAHDLLQRITKDDGSVLDIERPRGIRLRTNQNSQ